MSHAVLHGIGSSLIPQADFEASKDDNGKWTGSQSFLVKKGSLGLVEEKFDAGVRISQLDPNFEPSKYFLKVSSYRISNEVGGMTRITANFSGYDVESYVTAPSAGSPDDGVDPFKDDDEKDQGSSDQANYPQNQAQEASTPTYSLRGVLTDLPLSMHYKWTRLSTDEKVALGKLIDGTQTLQDDGTLGNYMQFVDYSLSGEEKTREVLVRHRDSAGEVVTLTGDALTFAQKIVNGERTFLAPSFEWSKRWTARQALSGAQLNGIGKIVGSPSGSPPTSDGNRNWMITNVQMNQEGYGKSALFTFEVGYLMSHKGGFDSFLYGT